MQIIPIASGKGGVGKSLLAANLAISLAQTGKQVVLADMDIGSSNLHLVLGQAASKTGLGTYLIGKSKFEDIVVDTEYKNLRFIPGDAEIPGLTTMPQRLKIDLILKLRKVDCDFLILDLGAGTHLNILDFFLLSPRGIIVTTPSVTATLNAYLFLKNAVFRLMTNSFKPESAAYKRLAEISKNSDFFQKLYIPRLVEKIGEIDDASVNAFKRRMAMFKPRLIFNLVDNQNDVRKAQKIRNSCADYLDVELEHLGVLHRDVLQEVALASHLPIVIFKPKSILAQGIFRISQRIIESKDSREFSREDSIESFSRAENEAEIDFQTRLEYVEDVIGARELTNSDYGEILRAQQYEINRLKNENILLKTKVLKNFKK